MAAARLGTALSESSLHASIVALCLVCVFTLWGGYGLGAFGFFVGLMAITGSCLVLCSTSLLPEPTICSFCCCFCPECRVMSNTWHLRNLSVAVSVFGSIVSFSLLVVALGNLAGEHCLYRCTMDEWDCHACPEAYVLDNQGLNTCCVWGDEQRAKALGHERTTSPESMRTDAFCSTAAPELWCNDAIADASCADICDCVQGTLQETTCYWNGADAYACVVNGISVFGIAVLSLCAIARYNDKLRSDGIAGVVNFSGTEHVATSANVLLGTLSRLTVTDPGDPSAMVVGQPVTGAPAVAVASGFVVPGGAGGGGGGAVSVVVAPAAAGHGSSA